jgi:hypothetical protein
MKGSSMAQFTASDFQSPSRSSGEDNTTCVDVACGGGIVELRDSKVAFGSPADHRIRLSHAEFDAFQQGVRAGRTDALPVEVTRRADGSYRFRAAGARDTETAVLTFDQAEVDAFHHDIHTGQYDIRYRSADPAPEASTSV